MYILQLRYISFLFSFSQATYLNLVVFLQSFLLFWKMAPNSNANAASSFAPTTCVPVPISNEMVHQLVNRLFQPTEDTIPVIHPAFKALGRIWVPWSVLVHTSGLDRVLQNHPHAPSLCILYQNGRCNSWERCNQIHVNRNWAATVWHALQLASVNNCCQTCGDLPSAKHRAFQSLTSLDVVLRVPGMDPIPVPGNRLAATTFWQRMQGQGQGRTLFFSPERICMLHQKNKCKYGVECKNVHLCRHLWRDTVRLIWATPGAVLDPAWDAILDIPLPQTLPQTSMQDASPRSNQDSSPRSNQALAIINPLSGTQVCYF